MIKALRPSEIEGKRNTRTGIRIRNCRVRKRQLHLTHRQVLIVAVMLFILMGSGIGYVWSNFEGTQIGYDLSRFQQEEMKLRELNQKLKLELATLKSPQHLEEVTRDLGLKQASPGEIIILP